VLTLPMFAFRVVFVVMTVPHGRGTIAETGTAEKANAEPRTVKKSRTASGICEDFLSFNSNHLCQNVLFTNWGEFQACGSLA
jgi:hypothetical protein